MRKDLMYSLLASTCLATSLLAEGMSSEGCVLPGDSRFSGLERDQQIENVAISWITDTDIECRGSIREWLSNRPYEDVCQFSNLVLDLLGDQRTKNVAHLWQEEQMFQSLLYKSLCDVIERFSPEEAVQFSDSLLSLACKEQLPEVYRFLMNMPFGCRHLFFDTMFAQDQPIRDRRIEFLCRQLISGMSLADDIVRSLSFDTQCKILLDSPISSCVKFGDQENFRLLLALDCLGDLQQLDQNVSRKGAKGLRPLPWLASREDDGLSWKAHEEDIVCLVARLYSFAPKEGPRGGLSSFLAFCVRQCTGLVSQKALYAQGIRDYILSDKERIAFLQQLHIVRDFDFFDCLLRGFEGWSEPEMAVIQGYIDAELEQLRNRMNAKSVPETRKDMALKILRYNGTYVEEDETRREALIYLMENDQDALDQEVQSGRINLNPAEEEIRYQWLLRIVHQPKKPLALAYEPVIGVPPLLSVRLPVPGPLPVPRQEVLFPIVVETKGVIPSLVSTPLALTYEPSINIPRGISGVEILSKRDDPPSLKFGLTESLKPTAVTPVMESLRPLPGAASTFSSDSSKWIVPYIGSSAVSTTSPTVTVNVSLRDSSASMFGGTSSFSALKTGLSMSTSSSSLAFVDPTMPLLALTYQPTSSSRSSFADEARSVERQIDWTETNFASGSQTRVQGTSGTSSMGGSSTAAAVVSASSSFPSSGMPLGVTSSSPSSGVMSSFASDSGAGSSVTVTPAVSLGAARAVSGVPGSSPMSSSAAAAAGGSSLSGVAAATPAVLGLPSFSSRSSTGESQATITSSEMSAFSTNSNSGESLIGGGEIPFSAGKASGFEAVSMASEIISSEAGSGFLSGAASSQPGRSSPAVTGSQIKVPRELPTVMAAAQTGVNSSMSRDSLENDFNPDALSGGREDSFLPEIELLPGSSLDRDTASFVDAEGTPSVTKSVQASGNQELRAPSSGGGMLAQ
ncbi:MAG: hypothetical protein LBD66_01365, partial [Holosporales bacterium]|nr:hypothetical protein [Holosporales bacterium]